MSAPPPPPRTGTAAESRAETETETQAVRERYARRTPGDARYNLLQPAALLAAQERQRAIAALLVQRGWHDASALRLLEVGCGAGGNLLEFLRMGCQPSKLCGIELLPERLAQARAVLPAGLRLIEGDACTAPIEPASQDVVYQATVFSSLLDAAFRHRLADAMWGWVRPGGAVLWYDFTVDNPHNPDVRGVRVGELSRLFPEARISLQRVTLAPPLARAACRLHPSLYPLLNTLPWLRTHVLAWIEKPR